jgi:hypothetical protein
MRVQPRNLCKPASFTILPDTTLRVPGGTGGTDDRLWMLSSYLAIYAEVY